MESGRHFQELLELKTENAKLRERVKLLRDIVKKLFKYYQKKKVSKKVDSKRCISFSFHG